VIEDRTRKLGRAMDPRWRSDDVERGLGRLHRGLRARRRARVVLAGGVLAAVLAVAISVGSSGSAPPPATSRGGSAGGAGPRRLPARSS
jgi:hypothetical protein